VIDINWIHLVAALILGFLFKVLFDELKSPRIRIIGPSGKAFTINPEVQAIGEGVDNYYTAYRIRVENKQKRYLNNAAENCIAWIELDSAPEPYQICWVGGSEITINVGDIREVDFCARGNTTGSIYAPTERGYFEPDPRSIGDGKSELRGKLRITSKNGRKEEKPFVIKPMKNRLEIAILDGEQEDNRTTKQKLPRRFLARLQRIIEAHWVKRYLLRGLFVAGIAAAVGLVVYIYSMVPVSESFTKATKGSVVCINIAAVLGLVAAYFGTRNRWLTLLVTIAIDIFILGMIFELVSYLEKIH